jgi:hypothetical protein
MLSARKEIDEGNQLPNCFHHKYTPKMSRSKERIVVLVLAMTLDQNFEWSSRLNI